MQALLIKEFRGFSLKMKNIDRKNVTIDSSLLNEKEGEISGYASVFNIIDQHNDIIKNGAFKEIDPQKVKLLWQHKPEEPIGVIEEIYEDDYGLCFRAKLLLDLPQAKSAYNLLKSKAISGVSIGFKATKYHYKGDIRIIKNIDLWEISLVTFPANIEANILEIKNQQKSGDTMQNQQAWESFKSVNEEILKSIEQKGSADPLLSQQLLRINDYLDDYKSRLDNIETSISRPFSGMDKLVSGKDCEHKRAFNNYLRSGNDSDLGRIEQKSLSSMSDSDGGYLITRQTSNEINTVLEEISPMRQLASCEQISTSSLDVIEDYDDAQTGWIAENSLREETDSPKINKRNIPVFELYAQPAATQKLIDDSSIDIERWLAEKLINSFAKLENKAFINGEGISCPRGILTYQNGKNWGQIEQINSTKECSFDYESILNLYFSLKEQYTHNARFLMNRSSMYIARTMKDQINGGYLWNPSLDVKLPDTLLGIPVYETGDMPEVSKGALSIAIGDFRAGYKIVDRAGVRVLRDPYTYKPFVKFYTTKRVGGDVLNFEAIKLLKVM